LPGRRPEVGAVHLLNRATEEVVQVFRRMGFEVVAGPEIEDEFHNFSALNVPETHPAREISDNFYFDNGALLRSQTSTVQIRHMEKTPPPVRMVAPGRVYRPETIDATHACMFHQVEGLAVDEGITFADLKHVLAEFAREFFGSGVKTRFRPHFFPFTEPSAEMDVSCSLCMGKGCPGCQQKGWIEVLGCGMVDPAVFEAVGYDPERVTGFAFGMGVERMTMQRYGVPDIRAFIENDVRFLQQF
ncbi:MAG: phenylalanine--tRNA ligase subunit alpha, partial [Planctomycetota bacterium]